MNILLVEKEPGAAADVAQLLHAAKDETLVVDRAERISVGMERLLLGTVDCVLLHLGRLDDLDLDLVDRVLLAAARTPVVVVADREDEDIALRAIRAGVQDVLIAGELTPAALRRAVHHAVERRRIESRLAHQALHDALTGLPNRLLLLDRLRQGLSRLGRTQTCLAILFVDLDDFKAVNDRGGHDAGDALLGAVARALSATLRGGDTAARMGGDEFVVLCEDVAGEAHVRRIATRVLARLPARASVGIALAGRGDEDAKALLREADLAMYRVKRRGGAGIAVAGDDTPVVAV